ncbi:actin cytoskeleton-regulatory complex protein sla1 [Trichoderma asperellum]|uniref:Actin cytoskeleton-regulatory complex protein SLA1 n=1 Tax=Trichoderma asperellum TaxID=101201 RepID=A0A6V8R252_TRIAP|nr:actin cytoskeleton-regulatory complex protein sla1 [Trichoderma asperellum]
MGFLGIYRAIYDYTPKEDAELAITTGDLLYILEQNDDDGWWKAKKKAGTDDEDEPTGLVPNNYVEKVKSILIASAPRPPNSPASCRPFTSAPPKTICEAARPTSADAATVGHARAIYEYTRQTDEELSFPEDAVLEVFDTNDEDWILAGLDGEYGFVPANYIELQAAAPASAPAPPAAPVLPRRPPSQSIAAVPEDDSTPSDEAPVANPAAALASVIQNRQSVREPPTLRFKEPEISDEESIKSPALPTRPRPQSQAYSPPAEYTPRPEREQTTESQPKGHLIPGGFHLYNINEMVSVMGKKKKMPTTLGINLLTGTILIAPERAQDDPPQEWTAEKMTHYSREGKHVFMELVRPSKSIDFHAGAKDTAEEIVASLGELAGAARAEGLREVIAAGSQKRQRKGTVLYDFMAQGEDEVTVAAGDEVAIIDDTRSEDWWQVRRLRNGKEGVVPSSYVEFSGTITPPPEGQAISRAKSTVEQNRMEEMRLTKEAIKASKEPQQVGLEMHLPKRGSSLITPDNGNILGQQRNRRENGQPDATKVRTWTDRSKSFSVEAQFLGLKDGKLHLHKMNGVKIAVPIAKMSHGDLEYVENLTGISLDDERPLADVKRSKPPEQKKASAVGASIDKKPEYDWFQFFLSCDVAVGLCERYAQAFTRDSMDESVLPDVDAGVLRNLGLREGDIIKVMRTLDAKFGRSKANGDGDGGLFSGPGGALRNNTRKGRPAPAVQTGDVVDAAVFSTNKEAPSSGETAAKPASPASPAKSPKRPTAGFDDDAWDVKPTKQEQQQQTQPQPSPPADTPAANPTPAAAPAPAPVPTPAALTGSLKELSLLSAPLEPSKIEPPAQPAAANFGGEEQQAAATAPPAQQQQQLLGASPSFFQTVPQPNQVVSAQLPQLTGVHISPKSLGRQRPIPPSISPPVQGSLVVPPPPQRPLSAPQSTLPQGMFAAPTLLPQVTGLVQGQVAPPGQSLNDLTQARFQQQYNAQIQSLQPQFTGYPGPQPQGLQQFPQGAPGQFIQPQFTGAPGYVDPSRISQYGGLQPQPTGFQPGLTQSPFGSGSINNYLPPALQPQPTGFQSLQPLQPTGGSDGLKPLQPLVPQKTGPPPPVRFGVTPETKKLAPQATGRRANLSQATPENPFGF